LAEDSVPAFVPVHLRLDWAYLSPSDKDVLFNVLRKQIDGEQEHKLWGSNATLHARSQDSISLEYLASVQELYAALGRADARDKRPAAANALRACQ
jgi:hypothetical protein